LPLNRFPGPPTLPTVTVTPRRCFLLCPQSLLGPVPPIVFPARPEACSGAGTIRRPCLNGGAGNRLLRFGRWESGHSSHRRLRPVSPAWLPGVHSDLAPRPPRGRKPMTRCSWRVAGPDWRPDRLFSPRKVSGQVSIALGRPRSFAPWMFQFRPALHAPPNMPSLAAGRSLDLP